MRAQSYVLLKRVFYSLTIALLIVMSFPRATHALKDCDEAKLRDLQVAVINCTGNETCSVSPTAGGTATLAKGSSVYMLGDSITNGASKKYRDAFAAKEITPFINANGGRAWIYPGSSQSGAYTDEAGGAQKGSTAVEVDGEQIAASDGIIIALGSNGGLPAQPIDEMIAAIRGKNKTAPIWWVNVVASHTHIPSVTVYGEFNGALQEKSSSLGYSIIDWHGTVIPGGNPTDIPTSTEVDPNDYLTSDGLHPTTAGQDALVALVTTAVTNGQTNVSGCACSVTNPGSVPGTPQENFQNTWNYFVTDKHLSMEAAAGLMGNLDAESGINPQNTQNDAVDSSGNPVPDGPEIPFELIKGHYGYGIAQWTSQGRQEGLIAFAAGPPARSTGDLGLQLDYLWKELTESYTGVLAKLQEPGITLEEASDEVVLHFEGPAAVQPDAGEASKQAELERRRAKSVPIFNTYSGLPAGSFKSSSCSSSGVTVNTTDPDTTDILCASNTDDFGVTDAYNNGVKFNIHICNVDGIIVNSQISGPIKSLLVAADSAGIQLSGGGFRKIDGPGGQEDIYRTHCESAGITPTPGPYPKASASDYTRCPGGAPPGYSNHEMGFAIDFACDGVLIEQDYESATSNPCFQWLSANAGKYGLFEYSKGASRDKDGYEAWHWSVDGS